MKRDKLIGRLGGHGVIHGHALLLLVGVLRGVKRVCDAREDLGRQRDGPLNHGTGKGWVKQAKGHYHDALYVKKSRVVVWLLETTGGICPHVWGAHTAAAWPSARACVVCGVLQFLSAALEASQPISIRSTDIREIPAR